MKYKRIAAIISAAAVGLALTGCGYKSESVPVIPQNQQNGQSSVTPPKPVESKIAESKPAASSPAADLPDIPVNDASAFEYSFNSALGGMVITGYKLSDTMVHIPETLDNEIVVEVNLKDVEKNITHLIMPDSVKKFSLSNATKRGLKYIYIPTGVTEIGNYGLAYCDIIRTITIPDSVTSLGFSAFGGCQSVTDITVPDSVTSIDGCAFKDCVNLLKITIPQGITKIEYQTYENCASVVSVTIPDGVTEIGESAFSGCRNLKDLTLGSGLTKIGAQAFAFCENLESMTLPNGVTEIAADAFANSENVKVIYKDKTYDYAHIEDLCNAINGN